MEADDKGVEACFFFSDEKLTWCAESSDSGVQTLVTLLLRDSTESGRIGVEMTGFPETKLILRGDMEITGTLTGGDFCCDDGGMTATTLACTTDLCNRTQHKPKSEL